jgi:hypothetical protein
MNHLPDYGIPLPPLSDEAAVEILDFLGAMFQIFETSYASQICRYYMNNNNVRPHPSITTDSEPF